MAHPCQKRRGETAEQFGLFRLWLQQPRGSRNLRKVLEEYRAKAGDSGGWDYRRICYIMGQNHWGDRAELYDEWTDRKATARIEAERLRVQLAHLDINTDLEETLAIRAAHLKENAETADPLEINAIVGAVSKHVRTQRLAVGLPGTIKEDRGQQTLMQIALTPVMAGILESKGIKITEERPEMVEGQARALPEGDDDEEPE